MSQSTLRGLIKSGDLPCVRLERKILVKRSDFDYWARKRQRQRQRKDVDPMAKRIFDELLGAL